MARGGYREQAGRKSSWQHSETRTIRVPAVFAERLLEIAHALDSGQSVDIVTKSKQRNDSVSQSNEMCPNCGASSWRIEGYRTLASGVRKQKRQCRECDRIWSVPVDPG